MFDAARSELPDRRGMQRTLAALSLSASSAVVTASTSATSAAAAAVKGAGSAALLTALKWGGGGAVAAVVLASAAQGVRWVRSSATDRAGTHVQGATAETAVTAPSPSLAVPGAANPTGPSDRSAPIPNQVTNEPPALRLTPPATAPAFRAEHGQVAPPADDALSADLLAQEIAVVDGARAALRAGRPREVLRILEAARAESFAQFGPETLYLRMEALLALGEKAPAARVARQILSTYPGSPQARSAIAVLGLKNP
jgi:hypothetical protein